MDLSNLNLEEFEESDDSDKEGNEKYSFKPGEVANVKPGMFVSGWEDPDDLIEEDKDPHSSLERQILWAATENLTEIVDNILRKSPDLVNAVDRDGYSPLHKACYNNNYEMAQLLLRYKANPNSRTEFKWTPLHSACKWNNARMVALVLQHGADVNAFSEGDQTPLHVATTVSNCRNSLVELFFNDRLKVDLKNNSGETALQIAKRSGLSSPLFDMAHSALSVETGIID